MLRPRSAPSRAMSPSGPGGVLSGTAPTAARPAPEGGLNVIRWQTALHPTVGRPGACHLEALRRIVAEAASAVTYLIVGLVVLIVVLVIENARRGGPATRTGSQAGDGGGSGGDGGGGGDGGC